MNNLNTVYNTSFNYKMSSEVQSVVDGNINILKEMDIKTRNLLKSPNYQNIKYFINNYQEYCKQLNDLINICKPMIGYYSLERWHIEKFQANTDLRWKKLEAMLKESAPSIQEFQQTDLNQLPVVCIGIIQEYTGLSRELKGYDLSRTSITDEELIALDLPTTLEELNLSECNQITGAAFSILPRRLTSLIARGCPQLENGFFFDLPETLRSLDFAGCTNLVGMNLEDLKELQFLNFSGCIKLCIKDIGSLPVSLLSLNLAGCTQFKGDLHVLYNLANLQSLNLSGCTGLVDQDIDPEYLPKNLQTLEITNCPLFTEEAVSRLPEHIRVIR